MRRDPHSHQLARMRTQVYLALAEQTRDPGDFLKAVRFARNALALYPLSPADWVSLADVQLAAGEALASQTLLRDAVESYSRAIALDDQRLSWETLRRFRPKDIQSIQRKIDHARTLVESP
jgi:tetratricopeptide (TPR) repeat protein